MAETVLIRLREAGLGWLLDDARRVHLLAGDERDAELEAIRERLSEIGLDSEEAEHLAGWAVSMAEWDVAVEMAPGA